MTVPVITKLIASKAATRGVLKKPALKILQIAQENICVGV